MTIFKKKATDIQETKSTICPILSSDLSVPSV